MNRSRKWSALGALLVLILGITSIGGQACESDGVVLSDNSSITTVTEPSGYIQVEIRPAKIMGRIEQRVRVECTVSPMIDTPASLVSVQVVILDSHGVLLRKQELYADGQLAGWVRHATYQLRGDESHCKLLIKYDLGKFSDNPGTRYSEYTVASVPITITG